MLQKAFLSVAGSLALIMTISACGATPVAPKLLLTDATHTLRSTSWQATLNGDVTVTTKGVPLTGSLAALAKYKNVSISGLIEFKNTDNFYVQVSSQGKAFYARELNGKSYSSNNGTTWKASAATSSTSNLSPQELFQMQGQVNAFSRFSDLGLNGNVEHFRDTVNGSGLEHLILKLATAQASTSGSAFSALILNVAAQYVTLHNLVLNGYVDASNNQPQSYQVSTGLAVDLQGLGVLLQSSKIRGSVLMGMNLNMDFRDFGQTFPQVSKPL